MADKAATTAAAALSPEELDLLTKAKAKAERAAALKAKRTEASEAREGESKADAFIRIANNRTNKAILAVEVLGGVFNKANYEWTEDQVTKIFGAIETAVAEARIRSKGETVAKAGFGL